MEMVGGCAIARLGFSAVPWPPRPARWVLLPPSQTLGRRPRADEVCEAWPSGRAAACGRGADGAVRAQRRPSGPRRGHPATTTSGERERTAAPPAERRSPSQQPGRARQLTEGVSEEDRDDKGCGMAAIERKDEERVERFQTEDAPDNYGTHPYGWGWRQVQVGLLFLALTLAYCFRINMSICLVEMTSSKSSSGYKTYDWSASEKSLILSSFFWGYICTQIPAGILAVKFGPKWFLFLGIVACSVLSATTPLAAEWGGWKLVLAWRVMQGLVQGFIYPSTHAMLSRWSPPEERGRHTAIVYNGMSVGTVVTLAGSGELAASSLGWPSGFWVPGAIGLAWGVAWVVFAANSPATCRRISPDERRYIEDAFGDTSSKEVRLPVPWRSILTSLPMWALIVVHSGQNFGHWVLLTEMPQYMKDVLGKDIESNGLLSSLPYVTLTFTSLFAGWFGQVVNTRGWLSLNVSRKTFQSVAHWGSGTTMLVLGLFHVDSTAAVVLLCVAVGFEGGTLVGYLCNHMDMSPNFGGAMMGVTNCLAAIVAIIAPILVGLITNNEDGSTPTQEESEKRWNIVFLLAAAVYYIGNLFWVVFGSTAVQPWNSPKKTEHIVSGALAVPENTAVPETTNVLKITTVSENTAVPETTNVPKITDISETTAVDEKPEAPRPDGW